MTKKELREALQAKDQIILDLRKEAARLTSELGLLTLTLDEICSATGRLPPRYRENKEGRQ